MAEFTQNNFPTQLTMSNTDVSTKSLDTGVIKADSVVLKRSGQDLTIPLDAHNITQTLTGGTTDNPTRFPYNEYFLLRTIYPDQNKFFLTENRSVSFQSKENIDISLYNTVDSNVTFRDSEGNLAFYDASEGALSISFTAEQTPGSIPSVVAEFKNNGNFGWFLDVKAGSFEIIGTRY